MENDVPIRVTIVYSNGPREVYENVFFLEEGATVGEALASSGLALQFPQTASPSFGVGIWGKKVGLDQSLRDKDRVEVYRSLTVDPKVARRERFVGQGAKRAAGLFATRRAGAKAGY